MSWFTKICRQSGLAIHNLMNAGDDKTQKKEVSRKVEEKQIDSKVTLRRTTIEEIEIKQGDDQ